MVAMRLQDSPITEDDFKAVVRILADIACMDATPDEKRIYLMNEIGLLVGTGTWLWGVAPLLEPGKQPVYLFHNSGGIDNDRMAVMLRAIEHPDTGAMTARLAREIGVAEGQITRLRQEVIDDDWFMNSGANAIWREADVGPILFSARRLPGVGISVLAFYRPAAAALFTEREARIAHIVLSQVSWLHQAGLPYTPAKDVPALPPRCRLILNQVVRGRTRKEIAADLGISVHTANDYMKRIFRHFRVRSQVELITRLRAGDHHDSPV